MPSTLPVSVAAVVALAGLALSHAADTDALDPIEWVHSYPEALEQARATGLPILLEFRCAP